MRRIRKVGIILAVAAWAGSVAVAAVATSNASTVRTQATVAQRQSDEASAYAIDAVRVLQNTTSVADKSQTALDEEISGRGGTRVPGCADACDARREAWIQAIADQTNSEAQSATARKLLDDATAAQDRAEKAYAFAEKVQQITSLAAALFSFAIIIPALNSIRRRCKFADDVGVAPLGLLAKISIDESRLTDQISLKLVHAAIRAAATSDNPAAELEEEWAADFLSIPSGLKRLRWALGVRIFSPYGLRQIDHENPTGEPTSMSYE